MNNQKFNNKHNQELPNKATQPLGEFSKNDLKEQYDGLDSLEKENFRRKINKNDFLELVQILEEVVLVVYRLNFDDSREDISGMNHKSNQNPKEHASIIQDNTTEIIIESPNIEIRGEMSPTIKDKKETK